MYFRTHFSRFANNENLPHEHDVLNGLSYSPADMAKMVNRGSSISLDVLSSQAVYDDGNVNSFAMPFEYTRGVDMNDAYELQRLSKSRLAELATSAKAVNIA